MAGPKALKVLQDVATGGNKYYYVEARAQIGFDAGYAPGVLIHTGNEVKRQLKPADRPGSGHERF